jgi:hypothetical protein
MGREFTRVTKKGAPEKLIGGGPGIVLSWAALEAMAAAQCTRRTFPVTSDAVPGGDGWLGQVNTAPLSLSRPFALLLSRSLLSLAIFLSQSLSHSLSLSLTLSFACSLALFASHSAARLRACN